MSPERRTTLRTPSLSSTRTAGAAALLYVLVLVILAMFSTPRVVGDGAEYLESAESIARGISIGLGSRHFWLYPALAAPFVGASRALGADPLRGFLALNTLLLGAAFFVTARATGVATTAFVFGALAWWVDKPHTEAFTFSMLAMAMATLDEAPWLAMITIGAAATQNPPLAAIALCAVVAASSVERARRRLWDARFAFGAAIGAALASLHPLFYLSEQGRLSPLTDAARRHMPTLKELAAIVSDTNIGLVVHHPVIAGAAICACCAAALQRSQWSAAIRLSPAAVFVVLAAASQAKNLNSGGTPGMSRYATWLIPCAIPALAVWLPRQRTAVRVGLVIASVVWSAALFRPSRPEQHLEPTAVAAYLWSTQPSWDNPLPEIFAERTLRSEYDFLPAVTPACEKLLLIGRGEGRTMWPAPCPHSSIPAECIVAGALCYANRTDAGYSFVPVRRDPGGYVFRFDPEKAWTDDEARRMGAELERLQWRRMRRAYPGDSGAMLRTSAAAHATFALQADDRLFALIVRPRQGATLSLRTPARMAGRFLEASTGAELALVQSGDVDWELWTVALPRSSGSIALILERAR